MLWICNFSNQEVAEFLKVKRQDCAPWITMWLEKFISAPEVELHIISPHRDIGFTKTGILRGVRYYLYNYRIPLINITWPFHLDSRTGFVLNRYIILSWVRKIKPDIIHIIGAENSLYSASFFDLTKTYPILVGIQGFISLDQSNRDIGTHNRIAMEQRIIRRGSHFAVHTDFEERYLRTYNSHAKIYRFNFELSSFKLDFLETPLKKWDCVFYGRIDYYKGILDALEAIGIVKLTHPNITMVIIGNISDKINMRIDRIIRKYELTNNLTFIDYIPDRKELINMVQYAKIGLLPSLVDITPGTITECVLLNIPVVSYAVGAIPDINKDIHVVELVNLGDKEALAKAVISILDDYQTAYQGACIAREYLLHKDKKNDIREQFLNIYESILGTNGSIKDY